MDFPPLLRTVSTSIPRVHVLLLRVQPAASGSQQIDDEIKAASLRQEMHSASVLPGLGEVLEGTPGAPPPPPRPGPTLAADFTGADQVALVPHQDDWRVRLGLPEEEAELGSPVEAPPVSHREDEDAHVTLQRGQVLEVQTHE